MKKSTRRKLSSSDEKVQKTKKGTGVEEVLHYATNNWDKCKKGREKTNYTKDMKKMKLEEKKKKGQTRTERHENEETRRQ